MKKPLLLIALGIGLLFFYQQDAGAQGEPEKSEATRLEVGAQFSSITYGSGRTQPGVGGRFTFNFNDQLALEAVLNYFPTINRDDFRTNGRATQALFGVKAGKRFRHYGIFAKARPGFISFSRAIGDVVITGPPLPNEAFPEAEFRPRRLTHPALDLGGVIEFYPSRRLVTRFDAGVTLIRVGRTTFQGFAAGPNDTVVVEPITIAGETRSSFQFSAGIGYRF